jgi:hypothetical protein
MPRAGRHGDAAHWLRSRRKFNDSVDAMRDAANERETMFRTQCLLQDLLLRRTGRKVTQVERIDDDKIEVSVSRTGNTKGWDVILLKIVEE